MRTERDGAKENNHTAQEAKNKVAFEAEKSKIKEQEAAEKNREQHVAHEHKK